MAVVAVIVKGYPRLSETFITQELLALEKSGLAFQIYALRRPHDLYQHPMHDDIHAPCIYLPEYAHQQPLRLLKAFTKMLSRKRFYKTLWLWVQDFAQDLTPNRARRFAQALIMAHEMPTEIRHIYFHFIHTPASVARYCALLRGLPYSGSAHAKDIWTTPIWDLRQKLASLEWLAVCTQTATVYLRKMSPTPQKIHLIYHGLQSEDFPDKKTKQGTSESLIIASVGRLVSKKGYANLLPALAQLPPHLSWRFRHIGGGDSTLLRHQAEKLKIADKVEFLGPAARPQVIELLQEADIFVLANIIGVDGDRDGIANVLLEAMWMCIPVLAGDLPSNKELISDRQNGLLCDAQDISDISDKLALLLGDADLRLRLAQAGRDTIATRFLFASGFVKLRALFARDLFQR